MNNPQSAIRNPQFTKILIANRGEIAVRIIRTCQRLGIQTVAVHSEPDAHALHVQLADEAVAIGPAAASASYLDTQKILSAARATGTQAIHPGYGFLSENADFAEACAAADIAFIGPTPGQLRNFGLKHTARELAAAAGLPMLPGSGLLTTIEQAHAEAERIGYPVMLKSSAGGGGIGLARCDTPAELDERFPSVARAGLANFGNAAFFVEKFIATARHIEVQIFGDGAGTVIALGERDCSVQRRNQKVIEETPAPNIADATRFALHAAAVALGESVNYASAGTVEFVYDATTAQFYFLEVNTRLQVEHGITEEVTGIDLVEWMIRQAEGHFRLSDLGPSDLPTPQAHSLELRLYAENPHKNHQPSTGLLTKVHFPTAEGGTQALDPRPSTLDSPRIDTWIETGTEVTPHYDPLLAKLIVTAPTREEAIDRALAALAETEIHGIETNQAYLATILASEPFRRAEITTRTLDTFPFEPTTIDVLAPGTQTSVQDLPGRLGYWSVGVPPSGPMDPKSFRQANEALGNSPEAAGLEITLSGPTLRFNTPTAICLTGAHHPATLDGEKVIYGTPTPVAANQTLKITTAEGPGARAYLAIAGGLDVPDYLGSKSTFALGGFGGHAGRNLQTGDVLRLTTTNHQSLVTNHRSQTPPAPELTHTWSLQTHYGPHGAPDFFTDDDIATIFSATYEVHYNSNRTGVRLTGPKPKWARRDGGEAGLHPSNIHDNAYAIGALDFTGDLPILLGPDGPSLGGFVCPCVVVPEERWKLGQLKAGDKVRFISAKGATHSTIHHSPITSHVAATPTRPALTLRQSGGDYLLAEYGPLVLDVDLRVRVHLLHAALETAALPGLIDLTPGIRSLQIHFDPAILPESELVDTLLRLDADLPATDDLEIPSRIVHLPISWDDPAVQLTIEKYQQTVRADAPWCPSNLEFIRRINGLDSIDDVRRIIFDASYLVMGLGDVYLGAPVATPLDPRHRLVTTKYNPARTWTPPNVVGIGGAYLCIYGMEGPGGYQLFGRTLQVWNSHRTTKNFEPGKPWLLRHFDQLRFFSVSETELTTARENFLHGTYEIRIEPTTFKLADYHKFLADIAPETAVWKARQQAAFEAERDRWAAAGYAPDDDSSTSEPPPTADDLPPGGQHVDATVAGNLWKFLVAPGEQVAADQPVAIIESMKTEIEICSPDAGMVRSLLITEGRPVTPGQHLVVLTPPHPAT